MILLIYALWFISPPVLTALAFRGWLRWRRMERTGFRIHIGITSLALTLLSWLAFVGLFLTGHIGGFGTHNVATRSADIFLLVSFIATLLALALKGPQRVEATVAGVLVTALWIGSALIV